MGRNLWPLWALLALTLIMQGVMAVQYQQENPISLNIKTGATNVGPGQTVQIHIEATDTDLADTGRGGWQRINDPVTLSYNVTGGQLTKQSITSNPVDLIWQAPAQVGYYALFVTAKDSGRYYNDDTADQIVQIQVTQPGMNYVPGVRVGANPQTIVLEQGNRSIITAQLFGDRMAGKTVSFFSTGGSLSAATATTDNNGLVSVSLTVRPQDTGTLTVAAAYGNTTSTTTVQVVNHTPQPEPPEPPILPPPPMGNTPGFLVSVDPASLPADGQSSAMVRIRLTDFRGLPYQRQNVVFRSTIGSIAPRMTLTDYWGNATAQLTAPDTAGGGYVVVTAGGLQGFAPIVITPLEEAGGGAPRIFLTIDPTQQMADGASLVRVEALVLDDNNQAVKNTDVAFTTSLGTLQQQTVTTGDDGRAGTMLKAPDRPGLAVVTATVDPITAASQVLFEGGDAGQLQLEIKSWSGQYTSFAAPNWLLRETHVEDGGQGKTFSELRINDPTGEPVLQVAMGANGVLMRDQYGLAHGYSLENNDTATIVVLKPSGELERTFDIPLAIGSHVQDLKYAASTGQVLVSIAQPDGTRPEVHFFGPDSTELLALSKGLESMPQMALGGDGYLALAFLGGTVRLYNPTGQMMAEGRRTDGLQATQIAIGPQGAWLAVASALDGQTERPPVVSVFSRQGGVPYVTFQLDAQRIAPVSATALVVATSDRTVCLDLPTKKPAWQVSGNFERFLAVDGLGVLAGHHSEQADGNTKRVTVVNLMDGKMVITDTFDLGQVVALTPPAEGDDTIGILGNLFALNIKLPNGK